MPTENPRRPEEEDVSTYDDATIGRAFKFSLIAFVALLAVGGAIFVILKRKPAPPAPKVTALAAPVAQTFEKIEVPAVSFKDATAEAGITFKHNNGAYGEKLLPETMGGGAAFLDYDNDGDQDLLFVNGTSWPGKIPAGKKQTTAALYQNDGKGHFIDVTSGSGLDAPIYGMGAAVGDYDRDGKIDVLITAVGGARLFHNLGGGKFKDETASAGVGGNENDWSTAATFFDMDNDGDLDLYVGNYVRWSPEIDREVGYKLVGVGRAYGQPMNFEGALPHLYRNEGNGKFSEIAEAAGLHVKNAATGVPAAKTLGVVAVDVDNDGFMDLIVANDTVQNHLFQNQKNGTFKEVGATAGIAFDSYGATRGAMGIDAARYRDDAEMGIAIGNFANEMTALYVSQGRALSFADESITEGIGPVSRLPLKFGVQFFDYDLDGRLDLLTCNGHLEEEISKVQASQKYAQSAQLFWNCGPTKKGCFIPVEQNKAGADLFKPIVGRGSAYADIDGDGDLDVLLLQTGGAPMLLRNDQALKNNWLRLKLVGKTGNLDAIGAWVEVKAGGKTMQRHVTATRSYLSQSELPVTIGLGDAQTVESIKITWPGNVIQEAPTPKELNTTITIVQM
ncbi:MAG TPA: CRTAC1 family protein [Verrucomicrobiae bacterium]|nr:CRTAC1 family protein [Verrucomicrobiae bacterium]